MIRVGVVNLKGGTGKTTIATHLAVFFAARGLSTALHDLDRQRCAAAWVERRSPRLPPILGVSRSESAPEVQALVVDAPAGTRKADLDDLLASVDTVIVPVLPSAFDEAGTARFLLKLAESARVRKRRCRVGVVANRWRTRSAASDQLGSFLAASGFPVVAHLRDSPLYAAAASSGRSVLELPSARARALGADWAPLFGWLTPSVASPE